MNMWKHCTPIGIGTPAIIVFAPPSHLLDPVCTRFKLYICNMRIKHHQATCWTLYQIQICKCIYEDETRDMNMNCGTIYICVAHLLFLVLLVA